MPPHAWPGQWQVKSPWGGHLSPPPALILARWKHGHQIAEGALCDEAGNVASWTAEQVRRKERRWLSFLSEQGNY
jgi:hypothetical protein